MIVENVVEQYWRRYLATLAGSSSVPKSYEAWHFGDAERLANELADLVRSGQKTATSFLAWRLETEGWKMPEAGDIVVITKWDGTPSCIIEITEAKLVPFNKVDGSFARDYGEGDRTLEWWHKAMWDYYSQECQSVGREVSREMLLVCQRFRLLSK